MEGRYYCASWHIVMVQGRKVMQMMVGTRKGSADSSGRGSSITSLPSPSNTVIRVGVSGGEMVAVLYFDGYITPHTAEEARQKLIKALQAGNQQQLTCCALRNSPGVLQHCNDHSHQTLHTSDKTLAAP